MPSLSFVDLFAGIGGFHTALKAIGGECAGFSEIAPDAIAAYCRNYGMSPSSNLGDITKLDSLPEHDLMTAGVPCQSWSIAVRNLGFDDDRGQLWNDTIYLLNKARPKAFIFENVKGLADPRNRHALQYITDRIGEAGYHCRKFVLNSYDYGLKQTRVRIYIVGFMEKRFLDRLDVPATSGKRLTLKDVIGGNAASGAAFEEQPKPRWSLSCNGMGFNDYFLFNDLRNGHTTIHSWDMKDTTERQKRICLLLLQNRRKPVYGPLDGNPLSLRHFKDLDRSVSKSDLEGLVDVGILKKVPYLYRVEDGCAATTDVDRRLVALSEDGLLNVDKAKGDRALRVMKTNVGKALASLEAAGAARCVEMRYDFKNSKISTGLEGINRIFLPSSKIYPTLVASDTRDFVATEEIYAATAEEWKNEFMEKIFRPRKFRRITREEACRIQGFPSDFSLPEERHRWMKLLGNSVAVPVVAAIAKAVAATGVFGEGLC